MRRRREEEQKKDNGQKDQRNAHRFAHDYMFSSRCLQCVKGRWNKL